MGGGGLRSSIILRSSPSAPSYVLAHRVAIFVRSKSFIISINVRCREKREEQEKREKTPRNSYFHSIFSCFFLLYALWAIAVPYRSFGQPFSSG